MVFSKSLPEKKGQKSHHSLINNIKKAKKNLDPLFQCKILEKKLDSKRGESEFLSCFLNVSSMLCVMDIYVRLTQKRIFIVHQSE